MSKPSMNVLQDGAACRPKSGGCKLWAVCAGPSGPSQLLHPEWVEGDAPTAIADWGRSVHALLLLPREAGSARLHHGATASTWVARPVRVARPVLRFPAAAKATVSRRGARVGRQRPAASLRAERQKRLTSLVSTAAHSRRTCAAAASMAVVRQAAPGCITTAERQTRLTSVVPSARIPEGRARYIGDRQPAALGAWSSDPPKGGP